MSVILSVPPPNEFHTPFIIYVITVTFCGKRILNVNEMLLFAGIG